MSSPESFQPPSDEVLLSRCRDELNETLVRVEAVEDLVISHEIEEQIILARELDRALDDGAERQKMKILEVTRLYIEANDSLRKFLVADI